MTGQWRLQIETTDDAPPRMRWATWTVKIGPNGWPVYEFTSTNYTKLLRLAVDHYQGEDLDWIKSQIEFLPR